MKALLLTALALFVTGCVNTAERTAEALADKEPRRCQVTVSDGNVQTFEGADCTRIADATASQMTADAADRACNITPPTPPDPEGGKISTDEYESYTRSFQGYARERSRCASTVASYQNRGGGGSQQQGPSDDTRLLLAAIQADTQIMSAWISQIPVIGTIAGGYFNYKSQQELQDTFQTAFQRGPSIGSMNITKSDDGGMGAAGEAGAAPGGSGGGGDQILMFGNENSAVPGDGSVVSGGKKNAIIAPGQNESILDPSTTNNTSEQGGEVSNAPVVSTEDNDGSGFSVIPRP